MKLRKFASAFITLILLAAIAVAQVPSPPPPGAAPPSESKTTTGKRGAITGQILADDGQPLVGVGIFASHAVGDRNFSRQATSDEEGKFKINDLPDGSYRLGLQINGYISTQPDVRKQTHRPGDSVTFTMVKGGVITGKVLDGVGQPLVGATVNLDRVRDGDGRTGNLTSAGNSGMTDDRGVYRVYGLQAGSYLVYVNGGYGVYYDDAVKEVPTYHPSSTRDTAVEVAVQLGLVVSGIDIRHRGERGYAITGTLSGLLGTTDFLTVQLTQMATKAIIGLINVNRGATGIPSYGFYGLTDGEYELQARRHNFGRPGGDPGASSDKRRVTVRGGNVTGVELKLLVLGSIAGRIVLEPSEQKDCVITRRGTWEELRINSLAEESDPLRLSVDEASPDENRAFRFSDLAAGRYHLAAQLPSDHWYVKAVTLTKSPATKPSDVARTGLTLQRGEQVTGVTLSIAEGAASVSGRVTGKNLPVRLRVFLVPAEKEAADDVLRYHEVVTRDSSFVFTHLAPGKYWLLARAVPDDESDEKPAKPVAWDTTERAKLRQAAEAANQPITLTTCQRLKDHALVFSTVGK